MANNICHVVVFFPLYPPAYIHGIWQKSAFLYLSYQTSLGHNTGKMLKEEKQQNSGCW